MKPGSGDGFLVWDKNGNGIIDDNTEMMSEFDENGNKVFQNGFEKLAFYFDTDKNGVIKGAELNKLKLWVDIDGDGQTDKGELQTLKQHGITEIVIPQKGKMTSSTKVEEWKSQSAKTESTKARMMSPSVYHAHLAITVTKVARSCASKATCTPCSTSCRVVS